MPLKSSHTTPVKEMIAAGRKFYDRGWLTGTSGNFSVLLARKPLRICVTASGVEKFELDEINFLELDDDAEILQGFGRPAAETVMHLTMYRFLPRARAILHTHSVCGTILSDLFFQDGAISIEGYEIMKGLSGVVSHEHREVIPIVENSQDEVALSHVVENVLRESRAIHSIYIRRHGLYAWGETVDAARRHIEIFEFLFEVLAHKVKY